MSVFVLVDVWVVSVSDLLDDCVEACLVIGMILDDAFGAISFIQCVFALDNISVTMLPLAFVVTSVGVFDSILELV